MIDNSTNSFCQLNKYEFIESEYYTQIKQYFESELGMKEASPLSFGGDFIDAEIIENEFGSLDLKIWNIELVKFDILYIQLPANMEDFKYLMNLTFFGTINPQK